MMRLKRILFPTDFSRFSRHALPHAVKLAREHGAELHLLHAIVLHEDDPYELAHQLPDVSRIRGILDEVARNRMGDLIQDHDVPDLVISQVHRRDVSAAPPIVEYAREAAIDLIVMGTHGRRGFRRLLMGSVAMEVIRLAPCSVFTVRGDCRPASKYGLKRILVPTDFSPPGRKALVAAKALASAYGAEVQLVHVLEDFLHPAFYNLGATQVSDLQPEIIPKTQAALQALVEIESDEEQLPARCFVREGHPAHEILRFAEEEESDLVVMATHGLRGVKDFFLGSTTERVISGAQTPVLVVRESTRSFTE